MICIRCHHPLKHPTPTGMGRVCAKKARAQAVPAEERNLFGYDIDRAADAAFYNVWVHIEVMTAGAEMAVRHAFRAARIRLGVWS